MTKIWLKSPPQSDGEIVYSGWAVRVLLLDAFNIDLTSVHSTPFVMKEEENGGQKTYM